MKDNSYDIPAYKFAILKLENENIDYSDDNKINKAIINNRNSLVPFECIDGLTINEIKEFLRIKSNDFIFICYSYCKLEYPRLFPEKIITNMDVKAKFVLFDCNGEDRIDTIIENTMIKIYNSYNRLDEKSKKVFNCFLERYQDKNVSNILKKKI